MNRRCFIKSGTLGTLSPLVFSLPISANMLFSSDVEAKDKIFYLDLIKANDGLVADFLTRQEIREGYPGFGGLPDQYGIYAAGGTAGMIRVLASALVSPESSYYQSSALFRPLALAANFMLTCQHEDGTVDLPATNFHSPPDTGFVLEHICASYAILKVKNQSFLIDLMEDLKLFILKGGQALTVGGIHTANHRWVVCMALARINALFPDQKYVDRIDEWFAEKIDIDPDGQYTEKSTAIYSPLTDRCLITIARLLDRKELYLPVRKNLDMTMYYIHSDGEVVTKASQRQDKYQKGSMAPYFYPYRFMAGLDKNHDYAAMAHWIETIARQKLTNNLIYFIEDPALRKTVLASASLPSNYLKEFSHSGLVRIRRDQISATILAENTTFFTFHNGSAALEGLRLASAFFGKGQFQSNLLEKEDGGYQLNQKLVGPYFQPFPAEERPVDGDWRKMNRSQRPQSEVQKLTANILIREDNGRFTIVIDIQGTDDVPLAIELGFRLGGELRGVSKLEEIPDTYLLRNEWGEYHFQSQVIRFGPGQALHSWTQIRGALPKLKAMSVYLTGFTPFKTTLYIL